MEAIYPLQPNNKTSTNVPFSNYVGKINQLTNCNNVFMLSKMCFMYMVYRCSFGIKLILWETNTSRAKKSGTLPMKKISGWVTKR